MTENEAHAQAFENGRKVGDAEGYYEVIGNIHDNPELLGGEG